MNVNERPLLAEAGSKVTSDSQHNVIGKSYRSSSSY
jgi:hypothetical protein